MLMIRPIEPRDREAYFAMAKAFYQTDAVMHPIPDAHFETTWEEVMRSSHYAAADILEADGETVGYALYAKNFSQEAGGMVLWVEEVFVREEHRGKGYGRAFFEQLLKALPPEVRRVRLEAERDNERAVRLYESLGFEWMEYESMMLERA